MSDSRWLLLLLVAMVAPTLVIGASLLSMITFEHDSKGSCSAGGVGPLL
jgi:hypothetical protein